MNCRDCVIVVLDHIDSAQIDDCVGCRVFLGPASGSVFVRDCSGTALVSVCQQFRSRDCSGMDVALHCRSKPVLESCREMRFGCCDVEYPEMGDHMRAAGLDILHNFWPSVYDFTADELKPGERSWDVLPPFSNGEDLLRLKELRGEGGHCPRHPPSPSLARPGSCARLRPGRALIPAPRRSSLAETHGGGLQLSGGVPNKPLRHVLKTMGPNARLGSSYGDSAVVVLVGQGRGPRDAAVEVAREVQEHLLSLVNCNWMADGAGDALSGLEGAIGAELVAAVAQGATAAVEAFGPNCRESVGKALAAVRAEGHGAKAHILTGEACEAFCKAFMGLGLDEGTRLG